MDQMSISLDKDCFLDILTSSYASATALRSRLCILTETKSGFSFKQITLFSTALRDAKLLSLFYPAPCWVLHPNSATALLFSTLPLCRRLALMKCNPHSGSRRSIFSFIYQTERGLLYWSCESSLHFPSTKTKPSPTKKTENMI